MEDKHVWRVGDLCTAVYNNVGEGIIYRVEGITPCYGYPANADALTLDLTPVHGIFAVISKRRYRNLGAGWCRYLSLIDLGTEYMKFAAFIRDEALRNDDKDTTVCTDVSARNGE